MEPVARPDNDSPPSTNPARFERWQKILLGLMLFLGVAWLVFQLGLPIFVENYTTSTNAMAPTILGRHWVGQCAECGLPAYCTASEWAVADPDGVQMICDAFHVTRIPDFEPLVHTGDRFVVAKNVTPRRWDLVVYQLPEDPSVIGIHRLVGLPGEEVFVREGHLWINGRQMAMPAELEGLKYADEEAFEGFEIWGTHERRALLADDEYFVLGDFSPQSRDSRLWESGATDHSPYAVPASHVIGVATHIYWPFSRWRSLRLDEQDSR